VLGQLGGVDSFRLHVSTSLAGIKSLHRHADEGGFRGTTALCDCILVHR
jgi:hypothetical protein